jgi:hypothetical protein
MNIKLITIPHNKQRYSTCGDWIVKRGKLQEIRVSDMNNDDYVFAVAIHEAIEAWLCLKNGVGQAEVDTFDKNYEKARVSGIKAPCGCKPTAVSEPGNDKHAPYGKYHRFATKIEKMIIFAMGIEWKIYNDFVDSL